MTTLRVSRVAASNALDLDLHNDPFFLPENHTAVDTYINERVSLALFGTLSYDGTTAASKYWSYINA